MIDKFREEYFFLSNFYNAPVEFEGIKYKNNEAAFQSAKTIDKDLRKRKFSRLSPSEAKKLGRKVKLRDNWEEIKDEVMYQIVKDKFTRNNKLRIALINTKDEKLIEGNSWKDKYWGVYKGKGKNKLGEILMRVRNELIN